MYKFYKKLGKKNTRHIATFDNILDPDFFNYIDYYWDKQWKWKLVRTSDNRIILEG